MRQLCTYMGAVVRWLCTVSLVNECISRVAGLLTRNSTCTNAAMGERQGLYNCTNSQVAQ